MDIVRLFSLQRDIPFMRIETFYLKLIHSQTKRKLINWIELKIPYSIYVVSVKVYSEFFQAEALLLMPGCVAIPHILCVSFCISKRNSIILYPSKCNSEKIKKEGCD